MIDRNYEEELRLLEVQALNFSSRFIRDAGARQYYIRHVQRMVAETRASVEAGRMTPRQAAEFASGMRNEIMEAARVRSSDIGRSRARALKARGRAFDDLVRSYSDRRFGRLYDDLAPAQQREVMEEIVAASGRANPRVSARVARAGQVARVVWVLTVAVACYNVFTSENRAHAAGREGASFAGGFAGGAAAGAAAGLWFGPLGVAVGVAVGGIVGAVLTDEVYLEAAGVGDRDVDAIIDPHTSILRVDARPLAAAILRDCGIDMDRALRVFAVLRRDYAMSADNVAAHYVEAVRGAGGSVAHALKLHGGMRDALTGALEAGWTTRREGDLAGWVRAL